MSNFIKIRPVGAELFHAVGQMDTTNLIVNFRNFANSPNKNKGGFVVAVFSVKSQNLTAGNTV